MVKKTEYVKNNLSPNFVPFFISCQRLNGNNPEVIQRVEIWDHSKKGAHERIGIGYFRMVDLLTDKNFVRCMNNKKTKSNGDLIFRKVCKVTQPSFLTLHKAGIIRVKTYLYIDFTLDNGSPQYPTSGHYVNRKGDKNTYEKLISKIISAMGFLSKDIDQFMSAMKRFTTMKSDKQYTDIEDYFNKKEEKKLSKEEKPIPSCLDDEEDIQSIKLFGFGAKHPHAKKEKQWS